MDTTSVSSSQEHSLFLSSGRRPGNGSLPRWGVAFVVLVFIVDSGDPHVAASYVATRVPEWSKRFEPPAGGVRHLERTAFASIRSGRNLGTPSL